MPSLALFDLDHTLLTIDSNQAWIARLVELGILDRISFTEQAGVMEARYRRAADDIDVSFCEFFASVLTRRPRAELEAIRQDFVQTVIAPAIAIEGLRAIEHHRERGDLIAIVSATNTFVTAPIAAHLGIDNLVATELELKDGEYTGRVMGVPSMRSAKVTRVDEWLAADRPMGLARRDAFSQVHFYTDSINDLALLEVATQRVVVNPDDRLHRLASTRGWPIQRWHAQATCTGTGTPGLAPH